MIISEAVKIKIILELLYQIQIQKNFKSKIVIVLNSIFSIVVSGVVN